MSSFANAMGGVRDKEKDRSENDYYPTPPFATFAFTERSTELGFELPDTLHEPGAGRGWMAYQLRRTGKKVIASDLMEYADPLVEVTPDSDFLKLEKAAAQGMITNPPYAKNMAELFVRHSFDVGYKYVAILARTMFVESGRRYEFFTEFPPSLILHFAQRFSCTESMFFTKPLSGMVGYSWFLWDYRHDNPDEMQTLTHWIDTKGMYERWSKSLTHGEMTDLEKKIYVEEADELLDSLNLFQMMEEQS